MNWFWYALFGRKRSGGGGGGTAQPSLQLTGPTSGTTGVASTNFTVSALNITASVVVTPASDLAATFAPTTVTVAPGDLTKTFTMTPSVDGSYQVSVGASGVGLPAAISYAASAALAAPASVTAPSVSGSAVIGSTLTRVLGVFSGNPTPTVNGRWQINTGASWADISPSQTGATYVSAGAAGNQIRWREGATNSQGTANHNSNVTTLTAAASAPVATAAPSVSGSAVIGSTLTRTLGTYSGNPAPSVSGDWQINTGASWADISPSQTGATYVSAGSEDNQVRWRETATNGINPDATQFSNVITLTVSGGGSSFETTFDALYVGWVPDQGTAAVTQPALTKPTKGVMTNEPRFTGVKFRRVTSIADTPDSITYMRHDYSRRLAYNANHTRRVARPTNDWWHIYDTNTQARLDGGRNQSPGLGGITAGGDCEVFWHTTNPDLLYFTAGAGGLVYTERNVANNTSVQAFSLGPKLAALGMTNYGRAWTKSEGRPSNDMRYWAFMIENGDPSPPKFMALVVYDKQTDAIVWSRIFDADGSPGGNRPDHVSMSPLGNYLVASWPNGGPVGIAANLAAEQARSDAQAGGVRAYNWRTDTHSTLSVHGEHSCMCLDAAGNEWYVWSTYHGDDGSGIWDGRGLLDGRVVACRVDNPSICFSSPVNMFNGIGGACHISGEAIDRPGWVVVGKYANVGSGSYDGQILLVNIAAANRKAPVRLFHHRSGTSGYWGEPQATPNKGLTRILVASDWGSASGPQEDYEVVLPSDWESRLT
jgi:hypothetical protein